MSRRVYVDVKVRLIVDAEEDVSFTELVCELDHSFKSNTTGADILDTSIEDFEIVDSK